MDYADMVGRMTQEQCAELLPLLLNALPDDDVATILDKELDKDLKQELVARWEEVE